MQELFAFASTSTVTFLSQLAQFFTTVNVAVAVETVEVIATPSFVNALLRIAVIVAVPPPVPTPPVCGSTTSVCALISATPPLLLYYST